jgi:hypothetical protein
MVLNNDWLISYICCLFCFGLASTGGESPERPLVVVDHEGFSLLIEAIT